MRMMGPGEWNPLPLARIQTDHFAPCYSCHGSYTAITPPYHNHDYILPQMWLQLLRPETAMSIMADGYSYDATVTLCPRPLQLYSRSRHSCCHCQLPQHLFFLLLPAQPTSTATTSIRAMSYCCHTAIIVFATAATTLLLADIHSYGNTTAGFLYDCGYYHTASTTTMSPTSSGTTSCHHEPLMLLNLSSNMLSLSAISIKLWNQDLFHTIFSHLSQLTMIVQFFTT